jgi:hypothetical protein
MNYTAAYKQFTAVLNFLNEKKEFPDAYFNQLSAMKNKLARQAGEEQAAKSKK